MDVPFINRLPPELLVAITTFIADQSTTFRLATICRHWHDVLTGTATLWTFINCRTESRTSILLQRSKSSPIDVAIDRTHYVPEAISLVASHTHRIRSIDISFHSPRGLEHFYPLLNGSAPILKSMWMRAPGSLDSPRPYPLYSSFFLGQFPALRTLCLEGYPFDLAQSAPVVTNGLTNLVLCHRDSHHLRDLLGYLEHCKNLKRLEIELPHLEGVVPTSRIVSLPNLRELVLICPLPSVLCHLSFPPSTDLIAGLGSGNYAEGYQLVDVWTEDRIHHIIESCTIKSVNMTFRGPTCTVRLAGSRFNLRMEAHPDLPRVSSFYSDCLESLQSLPTKTIESFRFARLSPHLLATTPQPQSCARLLTQMLALEQITLDISVAPSFIHALEPVGEGLLCPKLRELVLIREGNQEVDLRDSLLALSNQRKAHGCPLVHSIKSTTSLDW